MPEDYEINKQAGDDFFRAGDYENAIIKYDLAIEAAPNIFAAWNNKGIALKRLGRLEEALSCFQEVINLSRGHEKAALNKADVLLKLERHQESFSALQQYFLLDNANINDEDVQRIIYACKDKIGAQIHYGIVDLKFTEENQVKILEFGRGHHSATQGFSALGMNMANIFYERLQTYGYVRPGLSPCAIALHNFFDDSDFRIPTLKNSGWRQNSSFNITNLSAYCGIYSSGEYTGIYPYNILLVDDSPAVQMCMEDKAIMADVFVNGLEEYRPRVKRYPRRYTANLAEQIKREIPGDRYVLKVPDLSRGEGVLVVDEEDLAEKLLLLLGNEREITEYARRKTQQLSARGCSFEQIICSLGLDDNVEGVFWRDSNSPFFLVESYEASKLIESDKCQYDATMRVAYLLVRDCEQTQFVPMGAYWKLPPNPVGEGELRPQTVSSFSSDRVASIKVSEEDYAIVTEQLSNCMPIVFERMLATNISAIIASYSETNPEYAYYLHALYGNTLVYLGRFAMAREQLNLAKQLNPNAMKAYHEMGILLHKKGEFQAAITEFTRAIELGVGAESYVRRGQAYIKLGEIQNARDDFDQAKKILHPNSHMLRLIEHEEQQNITGQRNSLLR